jgi:hypothetical protein
MITFPDQVELSSGNTYQIPPIEMKVSLPSTLIMGTISHVYVNIHPSAASTDKQFPLIPDEFQVDLESKLEITKAQIAPNGLIHAALRSDQDTRFTWNITTAQSSSLLGTLWIYLAVQPKIPGSIPEEQPLFAIPVNLPVSTVLGLRADLALVLGIFGSLFAISLLLVTLHLNFFKQKPKKAK